MTDPPVFHAIRHSSLAAAGLGRAGVSATLIGGTLVSNSDRNQTEFQGYVRGTYTLYPGYAAFVKVLYDNRDFDQFYDRAGLHRSSSGYRFDAGVDLHCVVRGIGKPTVLVG